DADDPYSTPDIENSRAWLDLQSIQKKLRAGINLRARENAGLGVEREVSSWSAGGELTPGVRADSRFVGPGGFKDLTWLEDCHAVLLLITAPERLSVKCGCILDGRFSASSI